MKVQDRYLPNKRGDCDMGVKECILDEEKLNRDDYIKDNKGEEDIKVNKREGGCQLNGSDSIELRLLE